jgi:hypothetical protein
VLNTQYHLSTATDLILSRARAIEKEVVREFNGTTAGYKSKIRTLVFNLKDKNNPALKESVVSGDLPIEKFCKMTSEVCFAALVRNQETDKSTHFLGDGIGGKKVR